MIERSPEPPGVYADLDTLIGMKPEARRLGAASRWLAGGDIRAVSSARLRGRGLDMGELRAVAGGADIRTIDWKATARTGSPMRRDYTPETDRPALLVVDQRLGMFFGSRTSMKSVVAAEMAAVLAWQVIGGGDRVGALVFNDRDTRMIRPAGGDRQAVPVLDAVVRFNRALRADDAGSSPGMLDHALRCADRLVTHDWLVCVISDLDGAGADTASLLASIARRNDVVVCTVDDPLERELPASGHLVVTDGELQLEIDGGEALLSEQLSKQVARRGVIARRTAAGRSLPVVSLTTTVPVVEQLHALAPRARRPSTAGARGHHAGV